MVGGNYMENYICSICGHTIKEKNEICSLVLTHNWHIPEESESQQLFCHLECAKKLFHPDVPLLIND